MARPSLNLRALSHGVAAAFLLIMSGWILSGHLLLDKEAAKYIGCANAVLRGDLADLVGNYLKFASYVLFLVPFMAVGLPAAAALVQAVIAVLAAFAAGRLSAVFFATERAAPITTVLVLLCLPLQQWVPALYTESFFASVLLLYLERAFSKGALDRWSIALGVVLLFTRPVGFCFVVPVVLWHLVVDRSARYALPIVLAASLCALLAALLVPGIPEAQLRPIAEGDVICGFPRHPGLAAKLGGSSVLSAQQVLFTHDPVAALLTFGERVLSLFTWPRPYFSWPHNLFLAVHYPLLVLAIVGGWRSRYAPNAPPMLLGMMLHVLLVGLTHDEWSGRFFVPLWPLLCVLAAGPLAGLAGRWQRIGTR